MAFKVTRQEAFPFMFEIVRDNGRLIPNKLKGSFTSEMEAIIFLEKEQGKDVSDIPSS